jgi:hypothetical protein
MNTSEPFADIQWRPADQHWIDGLTEWLHENNGILINSQTYDKDGQGTVTKTLYHPLTPSARVTGVMYTHGFDRGDGYSRDIARIAIVDPENPDELAREFEVIEVVYRDGYTLDKISMERWASGGFDGWRYFPGGFTMAEVIEAGHPR